MKCGHVYGTPSVYTPDINSQTDVKIVTSMDYNIKSACVVYDVRCPENQAVHFFILLLKVDHSVMKYFETSIQCFLIVP
jgi:hypothetical protein